MNDLEIAPKVAEIRELLKPYPPSRPLSLALTKLDEFVLWLDQVPAPTPKQVI